mmetsp:Transcript_24511/g.34346  ORF Transcript_24511/g.34346 Transcript_24511/m.34346 type:complete len:97 (+) Transcript_24511:12-302(+)
MFIYKWIKIAAISTIVGYKANEADSSPGDEGELDAVEAGCPDGVAEGIGEASEGTGEGEAGVEAIGDGDNVEDGNGDEDGLGEGFGKLPVRRVTAT